MHHAVLANMHTSSPEVGESLGQEHPRPVRPASGGLPKSPHRIGLWLAAALVLAVVLAVRPPGGSALIALVLAWMFAVALAPAARPGGLSAVALLPAGFVLACTASLVTGLLGGAVGLPLWSERRSSLGALLVVVLLAGLASWRRGTQVTVVGRDVPAAVAFAGLMSFFVWVLESQPFAWWSRSMGSGTDFLRHLGMIRQVRGLGFIEPGAAVYPSSFHSLTAWLTSAMGVPEDAESVWRAVQPMCLLMLGLMLLALVAAATRGTHLLVGSWLAATAAGAIAGVAFLQTAWFSTFLAYGNVMNMVVGVCLLVLLLNGSPRSAYDSASGAAVCASVIAVTANAWQLLLPVVGLGALPWIVHFIGSGIRRPTLWFIWTSGAAVSIHGLLGVTGDARLMLVLALGMGVLPWIAHYVGSRLGPKSLLLIGAASSTAFMYVLLAVRVPTYLTEPTLSNLFRPDWWWGIAVLLSVLFIVGAWRRGRLGWSMTSLGLVVGTLGMTAYLVLATGSTWDLMLYYPVKAMWTAMVVLVPLASAGATALVIGVWRVDHGRAAVVSMALRATVVLVVCVTCLGVAGRVSAFPPHLGLMASGRAGMPNWAMAVGSALAEVPVPDYAEKGAIVFGIVPAADISDVKSGFVGMVDYMAMESVSHLGIEDAFDSPVKPALVSRDMTQVCRYLLDHPDSLRITGPNPATGPQWILDAGCPADVVKPDVWISLQFDPVWLDNSPWAGAQWRFPTTAELRGDNSQTTA